MSDDDDKVVRLEKVRNVLDGAAEPPMETSAGEVAPGNSGLPGPSPRGGRTDGRHDTDAPELVVPPGCPVRPLGVMGDTYFLLDANDQLREVKDRDFSKNKINSLFGRDSDWLWDHAPWSWQERKERGGFWSCERVKADVVSNALMATCSAYGVLDVFGKVRGRGGWRGRDGSLVFHLGGNLAISARPVSADVLGDAPLAPAGLDENPTGASGGFIYPTRPPLPAPWDDAVSCGDQGPGMRLLKLLKLWNWRRELDPVLLLGWIACGMLGGALPWRPLAWITGDRGTGKSTLHDVIKGVMGEALLAVTDATAAGIWQKLGYDCLAVAFDELENDVDNKRGERVIGFARTASSGGMVLRGGQDHQGSDFEARSCFLFSSINMLSLQPQDKSRMAILELLPLTEGAKSPVLDPVRLAEIGAMMRRRLLDQWPRFDATLARYRDALQAAGHTQRGADQFGALLAAQDLLISDHLPDSDTADELAQHLAAATLSELSDERSNHQACLDHLLSWLDPTDRTGERLTIGRVLERAIGLPDNRADELALDVQAQMKWRRRLETYGVKLKAYTKEELDEERGGKWYLLVANGGTAIQTIYQGSKWGAAPGGSGPWRDALKRLDGAWINDKSQRFGPGNVAKSVALPLSMMIDPDDIAWLNTRNTVEIA